MAEDDSCGESWERELSGQAMSLTSDSPTTRTWFPSIYWPSSASPGAIDGLGRRLVLSRIGSRSQRFSLPPPEPSQSPIIHGTITLLVGETTAYFGATGGAWKWCRERWASQSVSRPDVGETG